MRATTAIRNLLEANQGSKVSIPEIRAFMKSCTHEEWEEMGRQAANILGHSFKPTEYREGVWVGL